MMQFPESPCLVLIFKEGLHERHNETGMVCRRKQN